MAREPRDLIVLSDGTSNSASKPFKTNVWRLYQALKLDDGRQIAEFGDGVGNSSITILRFLGIALGIGVKRNVINLYKFLCHNYWRAQDEKTVDATDAKPADKDAHDRIWMFGFSRGAYTIRVLAGLVHSQGLVRFTTEADLHRNAMNAYRAFRKEAFKKKRWWVIWVPALRGLRDWLLHWRDRYTGTPYSEVQRRENIEIHFIGVWDTVAAYGLPIDELSIAVDKWVWPMTFDDTSLLERVRYARHAMGLDDERRTFHPIPWDEHAEKDNRGTVDPVRLTQVWFPGMHSDVGGGYPDDGLSFVPLCWMMQEVATAEPGLRFEEPIFDQYRALASPTGKLYDSRSGFGALWRYQPRNVQFLMDKNDDTVPKDKRVTPLVHHSTVTRMSYGNDGYAPKSLPFKINVLLPDNDRVAYDKDAVIAKRATATGAPTQRVLGNLTTLIETTSELEKMRGFLFALVLDTIWLRRCVYFLTLGLALTVLAFPVASAIWDLGDSTAKINQITGGAVNWALSLFKGFIPAYANPWVDAVSADPPLAVVIVLALIASLATSKVLEMRILDRSRAAWNVQPKVGDDDMDRMRLAGQRYLLLMAAVILFAVAFVASVSDTKWWGFWLPLVLALACLGLLIKRFRRRDDPAQVDPVHPGFPLSWARRLRNSKGAVATYRWFARTALPAVFILIVAWIALCGINLAAYNAYSTNGAFCESRPIDKSKTKEELQAEAQRLAVTEKLGSTTIDIKLPCDRTKMWLIAGRPYRIQIEPGWAANKDGVFEQKPDYAWFDKGIPADVTGFGTSGFTHITAALLRRWWRENWFQPVARIGDIGNYEYPLHPVTPLPKVDFKACRPPSPGFWGGLTQLIWGPREDASKPATLDYIKAALDCEQKKGIRRNPALIADITPAATGELYIYVNDAILAWESRTGHTFYLNNNGKAKVTVTRLVAPAAVAGEPDTILAPGELK